MPPSADPPRPARGRSIPGLAPRAWLYIAIAFVLGIGLFLLIWAQQRNADDFYRADSSRTGASGMEFEPLPQPATGDAGLGEAPTAPEDGGGEPLARIVDTRPPPAPEPPVAPAAPGQAASGAVTPPVPVSSPPPEYPRAALRRRESGEVLLRVQVGPDGVPSDVSLIRGSGSRHLDRAASEAVRRWRFRPAMRGGQPVSGEVQVPISFQPGR